MLFRSLASVVADEHVQARGGIVEVDGARLPAPTPRLGTTPGRIARPAPALGADTDAVLEDWLG